MKLTMTWGHRTGVISLFGVAAITFLVFIAPLISRQPGVSGVQSAIDIRGSSADPGQDGDSQANLNLDVSDRPLQAVVEDLTRQTRVHFTLTEAVQDRRVTVRLTDLPFEAGLRLLFQDFDSCFLYGGTADGASGLTAVWVFPRGEGREAMLSRTPVKHQTAGQLVAASVQQPNAETSIEQIASAGDDAPGLIETALVDPDDRVRMNALQSASLNAIALDPTLLESLARDDPSPRVRSIALSILVGTTMTQEDEEPTDPVGDVLSEDASAFVQQALLDPSPEVSEFARRLLAASRDLPSPSVDEFPQSEVTMEADQ